MLDLLSDLCIFRKWESTMSDKDMAITNLSGEVEIEWDAGQLNSYFTSCQKVYNDFLLMSDELIKAFDEFCNDEKHKGPEADSAKAFITEKQKPLLIDIIDDIQKLEELQENLMTDFVEKVDKSSAARISTAHLKKVTDDFIALEDSLETTGKAIEETVTHLNSTCSEVATFTTPDYSPFYKEMEKLASNDGLTGIAPEQRKALLDFDAEHKTDISVSDYKSIYDTIVQNIASFMAGLGDGKCYDITSYNDTGDKLKWVSPKEVLSGKALDDYLEYCDTMKDYLNGKKPRCAVYKYDPVNMCSGNYINEHEDIVLGGRYSLSFKRFYNAISEEEGSLGLGWTHTYEKRIKEDNGKIRIKYPDGSKGIYKKINEKKNLYMEEHGEPGILEALTDGYIISQDDGSYERFDYQGYMIAQGDNDGENVSISYEKSKSGKRLLSKVEAKNKNSLTFSYYEEEVNEGLIKEVTDQSGRFICYTYEDRRLVSIKELDGAIRRFTYTDDNRIKDVINPKGIIAITNEYDDKGRTIKQTFPDNTEMTYEYDDKKQTTLATEQNKNQVIYTHDELGRHTKTTYYDGEERYTYNDRNQKTSFTDKRGNTTRFGYDNKGHLTKIIDAGRNKTSITYRADGKPMAVKGARGEEYKYTYDPEGKLFEIRNPLDETNRFYYRNGNLEKTRNAASALTYFSYDERSNVNRITDPDGVVTEYVYDKLNRVITSKTADGAETKYEYDAADRIVKTEDALGNTREYTYDETGKVTSVKEADGTVKEYELNVMGRVSKVIDETGNVTKISYNEMGKQDEVILPNGGVIKYEYDPLMRLTKVTDPEGRTTGYEYDVNGNVIAEYLGDERVRTFEYDVLNRVIKETDALSHEKTYSYDENGNVIEETDTLGHKNEKEYDLLNRVIKETDALGNETSYTYTKLGDIETITDAAKRVRRFEYTDAGKLKAIYFCDRLEQELSYDKVGRVEKRSFADGYTIEYKYDALSRIENVKGSDGREVSYEYDAMGRATKVVDGRSTTLYTYTATGRLKSVVDALGNETAYTYDSLDNLKSITRAEGRIENVNTDSENFPTVGKDGHVTLYSYDLSGQLTKVTDALGQVETYEYDQYGRLITKTDRDNYATSYTYNALGAVTKVGYADGRSVEFAYNELNQLSAINDWLGKTTLENDILGRLTKVTDYKNRTVSYEYNSIGEKTKLVYPDGREAIYNYDEDAKLVSVVGNKEETTYSYDELGRLVNKSFANGTSQAYTYLPGGNLKSMESTDKEGVLDKYFYTYDNTGLISEISRDRRGLEKVSGKYEYKYDAIGRLTNTIHDGKEKAAYSYDAFGNRTSLVENDTRKTYNYDVLDRLVEAKELNNSQAVVKTYEYDKRGNQTKEYVGGQLQKTFTFDATNMLSKVVDEAKGELENLYNGLGFRVASTKPEEKIEYLCDLSRDYYNLLERTVNGETESFIYDNNVISMSKAGSSYYYLQDELGSPMYLTGTDGMAVSSYAFDDFGRNIDPLTGKERTANKKHDYITKGNIIQPFAFTGYQEEEVSGLKFAQARFYSADNGRFIGEDQLRGHLDNVESQHSYLYCFNNAISFIDENGKTPSQIGPATGSYFEAPKEESIYNNYLPDTPNIDVDNNSCVDSDDGVSADDLSNGKSLAENVLDAATVTTIAASKYYSHRGKQISSALRSARIARPGHSLSAYRSNNAIRRSMRQEAAKNLARAEKANSFAKKLDKIGKVASVVAVAADVGIGIYDNIKRKQPIGRIVSDAIVDTAVSTTEIVVATAVTTLIFGSGVGIVAAIGAIAISSAISYVVDDHKDSKGKSLRDKAKDSIFNLGKKLFGKEEE